MAATMLCRLAHLPSVVGKLGGTGRDALLRAKCLITRLIVALQFASLGAMVRAMGAWRSAAVSSGEVRYVVLAVGHMWDDTTQRLRETRPTDNARQPRQRVGKTILVQKTMVNATAMHLEPGGRQTNFSRSESWLVPPVEVPGKTAADLRAAMLASSACGRMGPLDIENRQCMHAMAGSLDALVLTLWPDGASSNIRWLRHVCGIAQRDEWPPNILLDAQEVCLLHQVHRIKTYSMESLSIIGLLFCLSKLVRAGSVWPSFVDELTASIDQDTERRPYMQPPPGSHSEVPSLVLPPV